jgi:hypothetical protein
MRGPLTSDSEAERSITGGIRTRRALRMTPRAYVLLALKDSGLGVKGDHPRKARTK